VSGEAILGVENIGERWGGRGSALNPRWRSSQRSPDALAGAEGVAALTKNPTSALGLQLFGLEKFWARPCHL